MTTKKFAKNNIAKVCAVQQFWQKLAKPSSDVRFISDWAS